MARGFGGTWLVLSLLASGCTAPADEIDQPQLLVGSWQGQPFPGAQIRCTFGVDGQYLFAVTTAEGIFGGEGTWRWEGDRLRTDTLTSDGARSTQLRPVFVDAAHLLLAPLIASGDPDGVVGTWSLASELTTILPSGELETFQVLQTWDFTEDHALRFNDAAPTPPLDLRGSWEQEDRTVTVDLEGALEDKPQLTLYASRYLTNAIYDRVK